MIRSNAASLYGWDILLRGVFWPGPNIGQECGSLMRAAAASGHEVGVHAWDHHRWQAKLDSMSKPELQAEIDNGVMALTEILGREPTCSAAAGWRCNQAVLAQKERHAMKYHSDCRGISVFRPIVNGIPATPQIPVTLPTYDELIGHNGVSDDNFNAVLLDKVEPRRLNVLTIHAEVEGIAKSELFAAFLIEAERRGISFAPLGELLPGIENIEVGTVVEKRISGRDGLVCVQAV
jgi:undecaprenyl phosphate-alpha-L-ara4FN deformylase